MRVRPSQVTPSQMSSRSSPNSAIRQREIDPPFPLGRSVGTGDGATVGDAGIGEAVAVTVGDALGASSTIDSEAPSNGPELSCGGAMAAGAGGASALISDSPVSAEPSVSDSAESSGCIALLTIGPDSSVGAAPPETSPGS